MDNLVRLLPVARLLGGVVWYLKQIAHIVLVPCRCESLPEAKRPFQQGPVHGLCPSNILLLSSPTGELQITSALVLKQSEKSWPAKYATEFAVVQYMLCFSFRDVRLLSLYYPILRFLWVQIIDMRVSMWCGVFFIFLPMVLTQAGRRAVRRRSRLGSRGVHDVSEACSQESSGRAAR